MKTNRQSKILELIQKYEIVTQEELLAHLLKEGYSVTQATVSRDIRELKLTKILLSNGRQKYAVLSEEKEHMTDKFVRIFREGFLSMDVAQNILVIKTVAGMASAVAAAIDAMHIDGIIGSIAGDDTIMCAVRTSSDSVEIMKRLRRIVKPDA